MHVSMLSPRGGGGPRADMGHLAFQKNFWSKSPLRGPKIWSNQIKYPQVFHQFILKMSSQKPVFLYKYTNKFLPLLKAAVFQGFTKAPKAALLQFQDGRRSTCPFLKRHFRDTKKIF